MKPLVSFLTTGILCAHIASAFAQRPQDLSRWKNGPATNEDYFPIAVWLQDPRNALRYKAAGINLYLGLWRGPTTNQLTQLQQAGIQVICAQKVHGVGP